MGIIKKETHAECLNTVKLNNELYCIKGKVYEITDIFRDQANYGDGWLYAIESEHPEYGYVVTEDDKNFRLIKKSEGII